MNDTSVKSANHPILNVVVANDIDFCFLQIFYATKNLQKLKLIWGDILMMFLTDQAVVDLKMTLTCNIFRSLPVGVHTNLLLRKLFRTYNFQLR